MLLFGRKAATLPASGTYPTFKLSATIICITCLWSFIISLHNLSYVFPSAPKSAISDGVRYCPLSPLRNVSNLALNLAQSSSMNVNTNGAGLQRERQSFERGVSVRASELDRRGHHLPTSPVTLIFIRPVPCQNETFPTKASGCRGVNSKLPYTRFASTPYSVETAMVKKRQRIITDAGFSRN